MMKTGFFRNIETVLAVALNALSLTVAAQPKAAGDTAPADTIKFTGTAATFTDPRDGKNYKTVTMPDGRTWFAQNLYYTKGLSFNAYSYEAHGDQFTSMANGVPAVGSYWCPMIYVGGNDKTPCETYGALYTWETAMMVDGKYADESKTSSAWDESWVAPHYFTSGAPGKTPGAERNNARGGTDVKGGGRGICPAGWHVPTDLEWAQLLDAVEENSMFTQRQAGTGWWGVVAGKKLKSPGTYVGVEHGDGRWADGAHRGTDEYGFSLLPAGYRRGNGSVFVTRGLAAAYWSSSVSRESDAWCRNFYSSTAQVYRMSNARSYGFSVRCIKD